MLKILHFADVHARDNDIDEIEKCLEFIVDSAVGVDLIICAGDVFDSANIKLDSQAAKVVFHIFSRLANIAPVAVIAGTPSHDGHTTDVLSHIRAKYNVWVSTHPEQLFLDEFISPDPVNPRAIISMVPAPTKQYFNSDQDIKGSDRDIAGAISTIFTGFAAGAAKYAIPHILVGHWNVTGSLVSETQTLTGVDIEISKEQMDLACADVVCLGHIHKAQKIGENIFFPGSICSLSWGEMDDKGFYIHAIDKFYSSEFLKTPATKRARFSYDLTVNNGDFDALYCYPYEWKSKLLSRKIRPFEQSIVRVDIKVFQDEAEKIDRQAIREGIISAGGSDVDIQIVRVPRVNVRSKKIMDMDRLRDKIVERARLTDHTVDDSILSKADLLQAEVPVNVLVGGEKC